MSPLELSLLFGMGLVGSLHCIQMCGPIVVSYSLPLARAAGTGGLRYRELLLAHLAYNLGRVTTYTALGAVAGAAGGAVSLLGRLAGIANAAAIVGGACMILVGLFMSGLLPRRGLVQIEGLGVASRFSRFIGRLILSPAAKSKFGLGLLLGFLPCGLAYAALMKSLAAGAALSGALSMLSFGLGTAGALVAAGFLSSAFGWQLGRWGSRLAAVSIALLGAFLLWRGMMPATLPAASCHAMHGHI